MTNRGRPSVLSRPAHDMALRREGVSAVELAAANGCSYNTAKCALWCLLKLGRIVRKSHRGMARFFGSQADADAYVMPEKRTSPMKGTVRNVERVREVALQLAAGPDGVTARGLADAALIAWSTSKRDLGRLAAAGELHARPGYRLTLHYFLTAEAAQAWPGPARYVRPSRAKPKREHKRPGPKSPAAVKAAPKPKKPASAVHNPKPLPKPIPLPNLRATASQGPAIVPPHVKVQVLPSSPTWGRHALPPGTKVLGGFATMGIGRYIEEPRA